MKHQATFSIPSLALILSVLATPAAAHSGHGNTLVHAVMHFLEGHAVLAIALLVAVLMLGATYLSRRSSAKKDQP